MNIKDTTYQQLAEYFRATPAGTYDKADEITRDVVTTLALRDYCYLLYIEGKPIPFQGEM